MTTSASYVIEQRVATALNTTAVAAAAGLSLADWTTPSHVFSGTNVGLIGARNRGRMPFMNYSATTETWQQDTVEGGTIRARIHLEVILGGADKGVAQDLATNILTTAFAQIRSEATDNYMALGNDTIGQFEVMPWGHRMAAFLDVQLSFDRATYQVG